MSAWLGRRTWRPGSRSAAHPPQRSHSAPADCWWAGQSSAHLHQHCSWRWREPCWCQLWLGPRLAFLPPDRWAWASRSLWWRSCPQPPPGSRARRTCRGCGGRSAGGPPASPPAAPPCRAAARAASPAPRQSALPSARTRTAAPRPCTNQRSVFSLHQSEVSIHLSAPITAHLALRARVRSSISLLCCSKDVMWLFFM